MKHIRIYLFILIAATSLAACSKFLERPPAAKQEEAEALKTEANVLAVLNGTYNTLGGGTIYGGRIQIISELMADNLDGQLLSEDFGEIYRRKTSIFGDFKGDYYKEAYLIVYKANKVLQYLMNVGADKKDRVEGEAKFLRAVAMFEVVRFFAQPYGNTADNGHLGVPIRLVPDIKPIDRATVKEVYAQILSDLGDAARLLPANNGEYASKYAALAFLAKVHFQMNDFAKAYEYANEVLVQASTAGSSFSFDPTIDTRWSLGQSKEGILFIKNRTGNFEPGKDLRDRFRSDVRLPILYFNSQTYSQFLRPNDKRKAWLNNTKYADKIVLTKYNHDQFDLPIVHVTEIKLIRAEAAAELNDPQKLTVGLKDINDILQRAGLDKLLDGTSAALIISAARREREEEMIGEGNRLNEIKRIGVRNNQNIDRRGSPFNCNGFILQFPNNEKAGNANFVMNAEGGCL